MSKFADFIKEKKLDTRRILLASAKLEKLTSEDRQTRLLRRNGRKAVAAGGEDKKAGAGRPKPRSGKPITPRALTAAIAGKPLSGPQKTRFLRAVNHILELKKQTAVELKALF